MIDSFSAGRLQVAQVFHQLLLLLSLALKLNLEVVDESVRSRSQLLLRAAQRLLAGVRKQITGRTIVLFGLLLPLISHY